MRGISIVKPVIAFLFATLVVLSPGFSARGGEIEIVEGIPPGFELVRLTDDLDMQHSVPDINDKSEVVFGKFIPETEAWDLYVFSNGRIRKISDDDTIQWNPAINNESEMGWYHLDDLADFPEAALMASFAEEPLQSDVMLIGAPAMNDAGDIVWAQRIEPGVSEYDIYLYTRADARVQHLTDAGNNQSPRINNAGWIVWTWYDFSVNPWIGHIMLYSDGTITEITPSVCQCQGADLSDDAHAVWQDENGVLYWNGDEVAQIAGPASTPRINNHHDIAFSLWDFELQLWKHALYTDGVIYILPHFGLTTARRSLNNRGEVAMKSHDPYDGNSDLFLLRRSGPKGDFNHDCHVDFYDLWILQRCVTAVPGPEGTLLTDCVRGDLDDDGDVDSFDLAAFDAAYTGPGSTVVGCEP